LCAAIVDRLTVGGDIIETRPPHQVTPGFTDTTATGATPEFRLWLKCRQPHWRVSHTLPERANVV